ncbi:MAG: TIM barrel protein [Bacteroidetes bacterium]|nr:TIM barrel protein [Bacteroidota bacterium]MBS1648378.1 TIM barrel protein [Bacteroidota bacterium]
MQSRREVIKKIAMGAVGINSISSFALTEETTSLTKEKTLKGNINHSVCRWTYESMSIEDLCIAAKKIGLQAIDLVGPKDWDILKKHGLYSSMCNGAEINLIDGWADKKNHAQLIKNYTEHIELVAKAGYKNLICFSGSRRGMDNETGWNNCVEGLKHIMPLAEKKGVTIVMELLNSKVNHKDYMCDKTIWGVELCNRLASPNFKLLYDIYHMQIDEGDVIATIQKYHEYIAHYHTAGVPGRHEIEDAQELNYPAIMKAIVATGFKGYVAQEFIPTRENKLASLNIAVKICDV